MTKEPKNITLDVDVINRIDKIRQETGKNFSEQTEDLINIGTAHRKHDYELINIGTNQGRSLAFWMKEIALLLVEINTKLDKL